MENAKVTIEGTEYEVPPAVAEYISSLEANDESEESEDAKLKAAEEQAKAKEKEAEDAKSEAAEATKKADRLQAKLDAAEEKLKSRKDSAMNPDQINRAVKARMKIDKVGHAVLGAEFKEDASDLDAMKQVIAKVSKVDLAGKSEDYVRARFDSIAEDGQRRDDRASELARTLGGKRNDADYDVKTAREKQTKEAGESWKQPLAASKN